MLEFIGHLEKDGNESVMENIFNIWLAVDAFFLKGINFIDKCRLLWTCSDWNKLIFNFSKNILTEKCQVLLQAPGFIFYIQDLFYN